MMISLSCPAPTFSLENLAHEGCRHALTTVWILAKKIADVCLTVNAPLGLQRVKTFLLSKYLICTQSLVNSCLASRRSSKNVFNSPQLRSLFLRLCVGSRCSGTTGIHCNDFVTPSLCESNGCNWMFPPTPSPTQYCPPLGSATPIPASPDGFSIVGTNTESDNPKFGSEGSRTGWKPIWYTFTADAAASFVATT